MYAFKHLANILENKKIGVIYQALVESIINYGIYIKVGTYDIPTIDLLKIKYKIEFFK